MVSISMVEHHRNRCLFPYLDNAYFQLSEINLYRNKSVKDGSGDSNHDSWSDDSDRSERADYRRGGLDNEGFI